MKQVQVEIRSGIDWFMIFERFKQNSPLHKQHDVLWCALLLRRATEVFDSSHANAVRETQRAQEAAAAQVAENRAWRLHHEALQEEARVESATPAKKEEAEAAAAAENAILEDATR